MTFPVSPSALKRGKCRRRIIAERFGGFNEPPGKAAQFGTQVHKVGERWMTEGYDPNPALKPDAMFLEMLPYVPSREMHAERKLKFVADGITFHGFIDFCGWVDGTLWVGDFKTSSRPWDYGLTTEELMRNDEQVNLYTMACMLDFGADEAKARWVYGDTSKTRFAFVSECVVSFSQAEDYLIEQAIPRARNLHLDAESFASLAPEGTSKRTVLKVLNEIPCNPEECGWGQRNCGFRSECELFSNVSSFYIQEQAETMGLSLKERIAANKQRIAEAEAAANGDGLTEAAKAAGELAAVEAATPAKVDALPPETAPALKAALEQRHLPPDEQDLGREAAEKVEKAVAKASKASAKKKDAPASGLESAINTLKDAMSTAGLKGSVHIEVP